MSLLIDLFSDLRTGSDFDDLQMRAQRAAKRGNVDEAVRAACSALTHTNAREEAYVRIPRLLGALFESAGDHRAALSASWYAGDTGRQAELVEHVPPADRARTWASWARAQKDAGLFQRAAGEFERGGHLVRAAIHYEHAKNVPSARALWSRLSQVLDARHGQDYAAGLARFNVARMSQLAGDTRAAREATVAAVHRLEEAADRFESMGQRERAFDCYHVLVAIGELSGTFEHVLEGMVNAIRILGGDNLRYHALKMYEQAIDHAEKADEPSAAATLARELTDYSRKQGMPRVAARGTLRQSDMWQKVADATLLRGGPTQLAENALLASLIAAAEVGQYTRVGKLYARLSQLDVEAARKRHYERAARRYVGVADAPLDTTRTDERFGGEVAPPDVWHVDLVEWEDAGSPAEGCAELLLDPEEADNRITLRSVLLARLVALGAESADAADAKRAGVLTADYIGPVGLYSLLSALERLYERPEAEVRLASIRALSRFFFKRSFVTLERALRDPDDAVASEASSALERLRFEHAWDPLARIYRTADRPGARLAALRALARIDVPEAAELLIGALDHGGPDERDEAMKALKTGRGAHFLTAAREAYPEASPRLKKAIKDVFAARGIAI